VHASKTRDIFLDGADKSRLRVYAKFKSFRKSVLWYRWTGMTKSTAVVPAAG